MKGITLITRQGLSYNEGAPIIKKEFSELQLTSDEKPQNEEEGCLYFGKTPNCLIVYFSPNDILSEEEGFTKDELQRIPFVPHATDVNFRRYGVVLRLIEALLPSFPELYVLDDEEDYLGPAADFIKKHSAI